MRVPPRRPDARLFDKQVLLRGALQGCGLFGIVLMAYLLARSASGSDETARALAFTVLVVSNLVLIHVNRTWTTRSDSARTWNAAFGWIVLGTSVLLALVLGVPAISDLFLFATPSTALLLSGAAFCLGALVWFESTKRLANRWSN